MGVPPAHSVPPWRLVVPVRPRVPTRGSMVLNRRAIGGESARRVTLASRRFAKGCPEVGGAMAWTAFSGFPRGTFCA